MSNSPLAQPRPINKALFEAGTQCAKRLYLDAHDQGRKTAPSEHRQMLAEMGIRLVELASQAFPKGVRIEAEEMDAAVEETRALLAEGKPGVVFDAAFRGGDAEVRTDILISNPDGSVDIFEVKAGTSVKPRHVIDVALQIHAIEGGGGTVRSASILHLNPRYEHDGGKNYPVQKLFKNVEITERARRQLPKTAERIADFGKLIEDESTLELPTGTWCRQPLPCPHYAHCIDGKTGHPLSQLPQLTKEQEAQLHEQGIEDIDQLELKRDRLSSVQRRVVRAIQGNELTVERLVPSELADVEYPLHFVHLHWYLEVLPRFTGCRPWHKLPAIWSEHVLHEDGTIEEHHYCHDSVDDPREPCLQASARYLGETGTLVFWSGRFEERIHAMLDELPDLKSKLRTLLGMPQLDLGELVQHGIYHPTFRGEFDLARVSRAVLDRDPFAETSIGNAEDADQAVRKILNTRTRAKTRTTLAEDLRAYSLASSRTMLDLYQALRAIQVPEKEKA